MLLETKARNDETQSGCSDRMIESKARSALEVSGYRTLRHIACDVQHNVLTLTGCVPSYHMKQLAQATLRSILPCGYRICNRLEVSDR